MTILFIVCLFLLLYTFIGYPLLLQLVKSKKNPSLLEDSKLPEVTIVLCIYNSANKLADKITNILASDYPKCKLQILIVSDGSTDNPKQIIDEIDNPAIQFVDYEINQGKSYAIAFALKYINTEYAAFTDIRQTFKADALRQLASQLSQEDVGAVSGNLVINSDSNSEEQGLYWKYEKAIRKKESDLNSLLGVTGAIYMAETKLLPHLPSDSLLDDMYIPLSIIQKGKKVKFCEQAIAYDRASDTIEEEFTRKVRTLAGNYQLMKQLPWLLSLNKNPLFFQFLSHKLARLFMPFVLVLLFISSFYLEPLPKIVLVLGQSFFYGYSLFGFVSRKYKLKLPLMSTCISFCSLNLAALVAFWKYFTTSDITKLWKKH